MKPLQLLAVLFLLSAFANDAFAQESQVVPKLINYQGKLMDANGMPLAGQAGGTFRLEFEIFAQATGGDAIWAEERDVVVIGGIFNVALGGAGGNQVPGISNDLGVAFAGPARFLQTTIVSGPAITEPQTLSPRQQLTSTPFAVSAQNAGQAVNSERLAGQPPSFWLPPGMISAYGSSSDPAGWLICDGRAVSRSQFPELFASIGVTFGSGDGSTTFNLPNGRGLVLRGSGSQAVNGRTKVGPGLGFRQEDQMQRIQGEFSSRGFGGGGTFIQNGVGALNTSVVGNAATSASTSSGTPGLTIVRLDSSGSSGARTSSDLAGETCVSSLGVNYIIKY